MINQTHPDEILLSKKPCQALCSAQSKLRKPPFALLPHMPAPGLVPRPPGLAPSLHSQTARATSGHSPQPVRSSLIAACTLPFLPRALFPRTGTKGKPKAVLALIQHQNQKKQSKDKFQADRKARVYKRLRSSAALAFLRPSTCARAFFFSVFLCKKIMGLFFLSNGKPRSEMTDNEI